MGNKTVLDSLHEAAAELRAERTVTRHAHTPGPWHLERRGEITVVVPTGDLENDDDGCVGRHIGTVRGGIKGKSGPNGWLMAAAPDLLEALRLCAATWGNVDTLTDDEFRRFLHQCADDEERAMWRKVRRAIARANGR